MPFEVSEKSLDRLEWSEVMARLTRHARTPRGRAALGTGTEVFAASTSEATGLLAETSEARAILDENDVPPLDGVGDVDALLPRLRKDGLLTGSELVRIGATARACA